ncbi:MAG: DegT/DnrJ/EryC1/StrS family aminotransferase [Bacteroidia bacterium]|nr:DegT/DnrJ/EryC1/StrS family aminotransferase [Bacteroidia bacterium]
MKKMPMVDLIGQYKKIQPEIDKAIHDVVLSSAYINGPDVKSFAKEMEDYLSVKHVIPCANGTDALQIAMMALNFQPGDEIITASFTYVATAEVMALLKLKPVLVDVDPETFTIDCDAIERAITPRTVAIVPVHLFGQCANMQRVMEIANANNLYVIEDTAQAIGSEYTMNNGVTLKAGTIGTIGTTSFFPSKNLGCMGDGGAIFTNNDELAARMRMIVNHGQSVQYHHDDIGVNSRLDTMQAAILRVKLGHLDEYCEARQSAASYYDKAFANHSKIKTPARMANSTHVFHQYTLILNGVPRTALREHLESKGIPSMIYYPIPLHMQKAYTDPRYKHGDFPVTEHLCNHVISLPMHTEMTEEDLHYITQSVLEFVNR